MLKGRLTLLLAEQPASAPRDAAVDLLMAVGQLQKFMEARGLAPLAESGAALDANDIFDPLVRRWIASMKVCCADDTWPAGS